MLDDDALLALRRAATLAHELADCRVRLRHGGVVVLEVARPTGCAVGSGGRPPTSSPAPDATAPRRLTPCQLRSAVAWAHRAQAAGQPVGVRGLPEGVAPSVELGLRAPDHVVDEDLLHVHDGGRPQLVLTTPVAPAEVRCVALDVVADAGRGLPDDRRRDRTGPLSWWRRLTVLRDPGTDITVVRLVAEPGDGAAREVARHLVVALARVSGVGPTGRGPRPR